jgi:hypothetical protein
LTCQAIVVGGQDDERGDILVQADQVADALELDDELLDGLVMRLGLE